MKFFFKIFTTTFLCIGFIFSQSFDGEVSFGDISFQIKDFHIGGDFNNSPEMQDDKFNGSFDIGLLKYGFSDIILSGDVSSYSERGRLKYNFSGPEFDLENLKINLSFDAPNVWEATQLIESASSKELKLVKNEIEFSVGKIKQYFGASGSIDLNERNQMVEFELDKAGYLINNLNANLIIDSNNRSMFNILKFKTEANNISFEFNTDNKIPELEKAAFQVLLQNLEIKIPSEVYENPKFKEVADYLNITSGRFRIRQIDLDLSYLNGRKSYLKGIIDTQFGKANIDCSFILEQEIDISDMEFEYFKIELNNLSRPIKNFIQVWENENNISFKRQGNTILVDLLEFDDIKNLQQLSPFKQYTGTVNRAEAAAEDAVLSALKANAEAYAMEKFMDTGRKSYPTNPFDGSSVDGYKTTAELAARSGNTTLDSGEWTYTASSSTAGLITHKRNDDSVWSWTYSSANTASGQADNRGYFGSREISKSNKKEIDQLSFDNEPDVTEIHTTISNIYNASRIYYQNLGKWPSNINNLHRAGRLRLKKSIKSNWIFVLELQNKEGTITAISTKKMPGGEDKIIIFDVVSRKFTGYGSSD